MKKATTMGIDLAKNVFQIHGINKKGETVLRKRLTRGKVKEVMVNLPTCLIGMEACGGAHYWARVCKKYGHEVKLMSPQYVKPYVKTNKNDTADAEAIAEAVGRANMRFVPVKEIWQEDIQAIHRIRERLIHNRTALTNQIRGLLQEYGIVIAEGISKLKRELPIILEDGENELTHRSRRVFRELWEELKVLEQEIKKYKEEIEDIYRASEVCQRIGKVEGVGPITATALVAAVGDARVFKNGRQMSAWLGLVPKQNSSGGKERLLGISKRGNRYIRTLLIHGARSVVATARHKKDARSHWIAEKEKSRGFNKACVALANKNARILWALMAHQAEYKTA